ncbi:7242_t:CDS:10 [Entrophospora sp. SA101]|nr:7242_t:CDS:10 [Entrophospora sp. SA101]
MNFLILRLRNDFLSSQNKFFYKLNNFSLQNLSKKKKFSNNSLKISELSLPYFDYSKLQKKNSSFSIDEDFILFPNHLNESEQSFLVEKSSKKLKRAFGKEVVYQDAHFDDVIHGYRECQATHWSTDTATNGKDEEEDKYSGGIVAGISLISSTVMIFRHKDDPEIQFSVLLEPGSLYVQRYNFTHEIPQDPNEHRFKGQLIPKKPTKLARDAYKASEEARYTKKICLSLSDRLEAGSRALEDLYRHREENIDVFVNNEFFKNLQRYVNAATEIKRFIDEISELSGAMKYINAKSRKEKVEQLITRYDRIILDLNLDVNTKSFKKISEVQSLIEKEFEKMSSAVETMAASLTTQERDIKIIMDTLSSMRSANNNPTPEIKKIRSDRLTDPDPSSQPIKRGKVFKKVLNRAQEVAWKLDSSSCIIKFHGIAFADGHRVMVFDWANMGNLKDIYEKFKITWEQKLKIVYDVCSGLTFLHACTIYHHDVRCENILTAKIANFTLSRDYETKSRRIVSVNELIPWMAPEKLKDLVKTRYTLKCEIFSFGMFVWELSFNQVPYLRKFENDCVKISQHVRNGKREDLKKYNHFHDIQRCFKSIVSNAWLQEPTLRPDMHTFLTQLANLHKLYCSPRIIPHDKSQNSNNTDEGIRLHKDQSESSRRFAWQCFKYHADVLDDPRAKYWKGYYLLEGYGGVEKDEEEASKCFKEAADQDIADAQVRYAFTIVTKAKDDPLMATEFMKYLEKAAFHENPTALYNLGSIYYEGKLNLQVDHKLGIKFYKKAALKGHDKSIQRLSSLKISVYDD